MPPISSSKLMALPYSSSSAIWTVGMGPASVASLVSVAAIRLSQESSDPDGIRTRVAAVKGPCPGPLDDGALTNRMIEGPARPVKLRPLLRRPSIPPNHVQRHAEVGERVLMAQQRKLD